MQKEYFEQYSNADSIVWDEVPERFKNALVAERVLGWKRTTSYNGIDNTSYEGLVKDGDLEYINQFPDVMGYDDDAMLVVAHLIKQCVLVQVKKYSVNKYFVEFSGCHSAQMDNFRDAVAVAALRNAGIEVVADEV